MPLQQLRVSNVHDLASDGVVGGRTSLVVDAVPLPAAGSSPASELVGTDADSWTETVLLAFAREEMHARLLQRMVDGSLVNDLGDVIQQVGLFTVAKKASGKQRQVIYARGSNYEFG